MKRRIIFALCQFMTKVCWFISLWPNDSIGNDPDLVFFYQKWESDKGFSNKLTVVVRLYWQCPLWLWMHRYQGRWWPLLCWQIFFWKGGGDRENFIDPACYLSKSVMCIGIWTLEHPDYALWVIPYLPCFPDVFQMMIQRQTVYFVPTVTNFWTGLPRMPNSIRLGQSLIMINHTKSYRVAMN